MSGPTHVNASERVEWHDRLQHHLVDVGLCDWTARTAPHPKDFADAVQRFFAASGPEEDDRG